MFFDVLFKASAECSIIEATCVDLEAVAYSNTICEYLNQAIEMETLGETKQQINVALASCIPRSMRRNGIEIASDFQDKPFYGKQDETQRKQYADRLRKEPRILCGSPRPM